MLRASAIMLCAIAVFLGLSLGFAALPSAGLLGREDRAKVDIAISLLEASARTDAERALVERMRVDSDTLFFLRGAGGSKWRSAIKSLEEKKAVSAISMGLASEDVSRRLLAAQALGRIGDEKALPPLVDALRASNALIVEGPTEYTAPLLALRRELATTIGTMTRQRIVVTDYRDRAQINKVIKAAERFMKNRKADGG